MVGPSRTVSVRTPETSLNLRSIVGDMRVPNQALVKVVTPQNVTGLFSNNAVGADTFANVASLTTLDLGKLGAMQSVMAARFADATSSLTPFRYAGGQFAINQYELTLQVGSTMAGLMANSAASKPSNALPLAIYANTASANMSFASGGPTGGSAPTTTEPKATVMKMDGTDDSTSSETEGATWQDTATAAIVKGDLTGFREALPVDLKPVDLINALERVLETARIDVESEALLRRSLDAYTTAYVSRYGGGDKQTSLPNIKEVLTRHPELATVFWKETQRWVDYNEAWGTEGLNQLFWSYKGFDKPLLVALGESLIRYTVETRDNKMLANLYEEGSAPKELFDSVKNSRTKALAESNDPEVIELLTVK